MSKLLIFDFDGTMTNAEEEGRPYRVGYLEDLSLICGIDIRTILEWANEFDQHVAQNQSKFGWQFNGKIVAPAGVDPYLRIMPTARMILDRAGLLTDLDLRDRILDRILYKYNYGKTQTVFRPEAEKIIHNLYNHPDYDTYIVTNSHTKPVQNKLRMLQDQNPQLSIEWLIPKVHGSAKKYIIDDDNDLPTELFVNGLNRPILLGRHHYFQVINQLLEGGSHSWKDLIVIGDIFELDLSLPLALEANVGLVLSDFTPGYERDFLEQHERGFVFSKLADVGNYLGL
jgi:5'(3')-deoxyribonucleotidase